MRRFLHAWWPVAAVALFTATLVLQIPRKALFFHPGTVDRAEPFVSFVSLDDAAYAQLLRRIRMAWQMRGRSLAGGVADSRTDAFDLSSPLPPPAYLPLRGVASAASVPASPTLLPPALLPPSLGRETPPIPAAAQVLDRDPDLLDAPEDLPDASPAPDFTLKTPRSIK